MASAEASAPAPALARCAETDGSPRKDSKGFFTLPSLDHSREYPLYRGVARLFSQGARLSLSTLPDELSEGDIILFSGRLMADRCLRCVLRTEYNHVGIIVRQSIHDELQVPWWPRPVRLRPRPLRVPRQATSRVWPDGSRSCLYVVPHSAQVLEASVDGVGVFPLRFCIDVLTWAVKQAP